MTPIKILLYYSGLDYIPGQITNIILSKSIDNVIFSNHTNFLGNNSFQNREENYVLCHSIDCYKISIFGLTWYIFIV